MKTRNNEVKCVYCNNCQKTVDNYFKTHFSNTPPYRAICNRCYHLKKSSKLLFSNPLCIMTSITVKHFFFSLFLLVLGADLVLFGRTQLVYLPGTIAHWIGGLYLVFGLVALIYILKIMKNEK